MWGRPTASQIAAASAASVLACKRRSDDLGPRKDVIIRMPEEEASQLKVIAALERTTIQDFILDALRPELERALRKHGMAR